MTLQVFQCGLSWRIVMTKSKDIAAAFKQFDIAAVAAMTPADIETLMNNGSRCVCCHGRPDFVLFPSLVCFPRFLTTRQDHPQPSQAHGNGVQRAGLLEAGARVQGWFSRVCVVPSAA